jgi:predicted membrane chloride channel (bestrophin family)
MQFRTSSNGFLVFSSLFHSDWWHNTLSLPNSAILMSIRGPVLFMSGWAGFLSIIYRYLLTSSPQVANLLCVSSTPHSLMSSALSLLLVFKTNSAYQRFSEGRKIWENIINLSRDMYRMINLYEDEMGRSKRRRLQRLIAAFPYLLRHRIRPNLIMHRVDDVDNVRDPENSIVLYQDKAAHDLDPELAAVATQEEKEGSSRRKRRPLYWVDRRTLPWRLLPPDALEPCARSQNRPLWVCDRMAQEIRSIPDGPGFTSRERLTMIGKVEKLSNSIGSCERIHQTAVPLNYARHSLRALSIWLFTLPLCLVQDLELLTAPAVFLVSWLMFGVYEIGYSIEDPFQGTLRLSVLCDTIRRDVLADEVIRNTAFERESPNESSDKQATQQDEELEYELSPIVKESRQVLKVEEIQKKSMDKKSKSNNENGSGTVVEELPVLPSKRAIWEGSSSAVKKP